MSFTLHFHWPQPWGCHERANVSPASLRPASIEANVLSAGIDRRARAWRWTHSNSSPAVRWSSSPKSRNFRHWPCSLVWRLIECRINNFKVSPLISTFSCAPSDCTHSSSTSVAISTVLTKVPSKSNMTCVIFMLSVGLKCFAVASTASNVLPQIYRLPSNDTEDVCHHNI